VVALSAVWITIAGLAVGTATIKAAGPLLVGGRSMPPFAQSVIALLAPALLAALVMIETFAHEGELTLDARAAGLAAAAIAIALRASLIVTMVAAALTTAALRAVT
jgi:branched-subunit amino acid transport protein